MQRPSPTRRPTSNAPPSSFCSAPPSPTDPGVLPPMATLLARLGRASFRRRGLVSVAWLALLGVVVALLVTVGGSFDDRFTIPGSESQDALDRLEEVSPGTG